jgi:CheY-like chemotaxis protein
MHGGTIEARSAGPGKGSEFTVRLPAKVETAIAPASGQRRILVADDNEDAAFTLSMLLETLGNEVRVAHDGAEAVEMAASFRPDAILLDIGMPKLNGYEACERIRLQEGGARAVIVALTGWGGEEDKERARSAGFDRHLVKPIDPGMLEELVAELPVLPR